MIKYTQWPRRPFKHEVGSSFPEWTLDSRTQRTYPGLDNPRVVFCMGEFKREPYNNLYRVGMLKRSMAGAALVTRGTLTINGSVVSMNSPAVQAQFRCHFYAKLKLCGTYEDEVFKGAVILGCDPRHRTEAYQRNVQQSLRQYPKPLTTCENNLLQMGSVAWTKHCFARACCTGRWELNLDRFYLIGGVDDDPVVPEAIIVKQVGAYRWINE